MAEARREAEEKRDAKYAKMERQREEVRQGIREKVSDEEHGEGEREREKFLVFSIDFNCCFYLHEEMKE